MGELEHIRVAPVAMACCCLFWFIFTLVTVPLSFAKLDQGKYALELNWATQKIGGVVSEPGLKMVGLGNMLVEFPATYQTMYFARGVKTKCEGDEPELDVMCPDVIRGPVVARSSDGLEMSVSVAFQWKLRPETLKELYRILGHDLYKDEFVRFARSAIVEACSHFTADEYFRNRDIIRAKVKDMLMQNFQNPSQGLNVDIQAVQLREVDVPSEFDEEIANTQEQMQEVEVARAEREEQKVAMSTQVLMAKQKVLQVVEEANGFASKILVENEAYVNQLKKQQEAQALANVEILKHFKNEQDADSNSIAFQLLFSMMKNQAVGSHAHSKLLVNM